MLRCVVLSTNGLQETVLQQKKLRFGLRHDRSISVHVLLLLLFFPFFLLQVLRNLHNYLKEVEMQLKAADTKCKT